LLYVYDAAGESYQQMDSLRPHEYYGYTHGILFLLDPFSLPEVRGDFESELTRSANQVKPCAEEPQEVYARMIATFRQHPWMKNNLGRIPFAIVLTKADAFGLEKRIRATTPPPAPSPSRLAAMRDAVSGKAESPASAVARQWLIEHGGGNLVRGAEQDFQNVRYFHCSALGRLPDGSPLPFTPRNVIEPLAWLLARCGMRLDETSPGAARAKSISTRKRIFASSPAISAAPRIHNQVIVLALWIAGLLGAGWWGAGWLSFPYNSWLSLKALVSDASSAPTPQPRPSAELNRDRAEVAAVIHGWIEALRKRDFNQYVNYYGDEYFRRKNRDRASFQSNLEMGFSSFTQMSVRCDNLRITPDPYVMKATAVCRKVWRYEGGLRPDAGSKEEQIDLVKDNGVWRITDNFLVR
jgi:hypothetical protein